MVNPVSTDRNPSTVPRDTPSQARTTANSPQTRVSNLFTRAVQGIRGKGSGKRSQPDHPRTDRSRQSNARAESSTGADITSAQSESRATPPRPGLPGGVRSPFRRNGTRTGQPEATVRREPDLPLELRDGVLYHVTATNPTGTRARASEQLVRPGGNRLHRGPHAIPRRIKSLKQGADGNLYALTDDKVVRQIDLSPGDNYGGFLGYCTSDANPSTRFGPGRVRLPDNTSDFTIGTGGQITYTAAVGSGINRRMRVHTATLPPEVAHGEAAGAPLNVQELPGVRSRSEGMLAGTRLASSAVDDQGRIWGLDNRGGIWRFEPNQADPGEAIWVYHGRSPNMTSLGLLNGKLAGIDSRGNHHANPVAPLGQANVEVIADAPSGRFGLAGERVYIWDPRQETWLPTGTTGVRRLKLGADNSLYVLTNDNNRVRPLDQTGELARANDGSLLPGVTLPEGAKDFAVSASGEISYITRTPVGPNVKVPSVPQPPAEESTASPSESPSGDTPPATTPTVNGPRGLSLRSLIVAEDGSRMALDKKGLVWKFDPAPDASKKWHQISGKTPLRSLQVLPDGQIVGIDRDNHRFRYSATHNWWVADPPNLDAVRDVLPMRDGRRLAFENGRIYTYNHTTGKWMPHPDDGLCQVQQAPDGQLYAVTRDENGDAFINVLDANGRLRTVTDENGRTVPDRDFQVHLAESPGSFTVASNGDIHYLNGNGGIRSIRQSGINNGRPAQVRVDEDWGRVGQLPAGTDGLRPRLQSLLASAPDGQLLGLDSRGQVWRFDDAARAWHAEGDPNPKMAVLKRLPSGAVAGMDNSGAIYRRGASEAAVWKPRTLNTPIRTQEGARYAVHDGKVFTWNTSTSTWTPGRDTDVQEVLLGADGKPYAVTVDPANSIRRLHRLDAQGNLREDFELRLPVEAHEISVSAGGSVTFLAAGRLFQIDETGLEILRKGDRKMRVRLPVVNYGGVNNYFQQFNQGSYSAEPISGSSEHSSRKVVRAASTASHAGSSAVAGSEASVSRLTFDQGSNSSEAVPVETRQLADLPGNAEFRSAARANNGTLWVIDTTGQAYRLDRNSNSWTAHGRPNPDLRTLRVLANGKVVGVAADGSLRQAQPDPLHGEIVKNGGDGMRYALTRANRLHRLDRHGAVDSPSHLPDGTTRWLAEGLKLHGGRRALDVTADNAGNITYIARNAVGMREVRRIDATGDHSISRGIHSSIKRVAADHNGTVYALERGGRIKTWTPGTRRWNTSTADSDITALVTLNDGSVIGLDPDGNAFSATGGFTNPDVPAPHLPQTDNLTQRMWHPTTVDDPTEADRFWATYMRDKTPNEWKQSTMGTPFLGGPEGSWRNNRETPERQNHPAESSPPGFWTDAPDVMVPNWARRAWTNTREFLTPDFGRRIDPDRGWMEQVPARWGNWYRSHVQKLQNPFDRPHGVTGWRTPVKRDQDGNLQIRSLFGQTGRPAPLRNPFRDSGGGFLDHARELRHEVHDDARLLREPDTLPRLTDLGNDATGNAYDHALTVNLAVDGTSANKDNPARRYALKPRVDETARDIIKRLRRELGILNADGTTNPRYERENAYRNVRITNSNQVNSSANTLHQVYASRIAMFGPDDAVARELRDLLDKNIYLPIDSEGRWVARYKGGWNVANPAKYQVQNTYGVLTGKLLHDHAVLANAMRDAHAGAAPNGHPMTTDMLRNRTHLLDTEAADLTDDQLRDMGLIREQAAPNHISTLYKGNFQNLDRAYRYLIGFDYFQSAMASPGHRMNRALTREGELAAAEVVEHYTNTIQALKPGETLTFSVNFLTGLDSESGTIWFKFTDNHLLKLEPAVDAAVSKDYSLAFSRTENGIDVQVGKDSSGTFTPIGVKFWTGILLPWGTPPADNVVLFTSPRKDNLFFNYIGMNPTLKLGGQWQWTNSSRFTIDQDDQGKVQAMVRGLLGRMDPYELVKQASDAENSRTRTRTVTNLFRNEVIFPAVGHYSRFNNPSPEELQAGADPSRSVSRALGALVLQLQIPLFENVRTRSHTHNAATGSSTYRNATAFVDKGTFIVVRALEGQLVRDGALPNVLQSAWGEGQTQPNWPYSNLENDGTIQDGLESQHKVPLASRISMKEIWNRGKMDSQGNGFTIEYKGGEIRIDTDRCVTNSNHLRPDRLPKHVPQLARLLATNPELAPHLETLRKSRLVVNVSLELTPEAMASVDRHVLREHADNLPELIRKLLRNPDNTRITGITASETHKYRTAFNKGLSMLRHVTGSEVSLTRPVAMICVKHPVAADKQPTIEVAGELLRPKGTITEARSFTELERTLLIGGEAVMDHFASPDLANTYRPLLASLGGEANPGNAVAAAGRLFAAETAAGGYPDGLGLENGQLAYRRNNETVPLPDTLRQEIFYQLLNRRDARQLLDLMSDPGANGTFANQNARDNAPLLNEAQEDQLESLGDGLRLLDRLADRIRDGETPDDLIESLSPRQVGTLRLLTINGIQPFSTRSNELAERSLRLFLASPDNVTSLRRDLTEPSTMPARRTPRTRALNPRDILEGLRNVSSPGLRHLSPAQQQILSAFLPGNDPETELRQVLQDPHALQTMEAQIDHLSRQRRQNLETRIRRAMERHTARLGHGFLQNPEGTSLEDRIRQHLQQAFDAMPEPRTPTMNLLHNALTSDARLRALTRAARLSMIEDVRKQPQITQLVDDILPRITAELPGLDNRQVEGRIRTLIDEQVSRIQDIVTHTISQRMDETAHRVANDNVNRMLGLNQMFVQTALELFQERGLALFHQAVPATELDALPRGIRAQVEADVLRQIGDLMPRDDLTNALDRMRGRLIELVPDRLPEVITSGMRDRLRDLIQRDDTLSRLEHDLEPRVSAVAQATRDTVLTPYRTLAPQLQEHINEELDLELRRRMRSGFQEGVRIAAPGDGPPPTILINEESEPIRLQDFNTPALRTQIARWIRPYMDQIAAELLNQLQLPQTAGAPPTVPPSVDHSMGERINDQAHGDSVGIRLEQRVQALTPDLEAMIPSLRALARALDINEVAMGLLINGIGTDTFRRLPTMAGWQIRSGMRRQVAQTAPQALEDGLNGLVRQALPSVLDRAIDRQSPREGGHLRLPPLPDNANDIVRQNMAAALDRLPGTHAIRARAQRHIEDFHRLLPDLQTEARTLIYQAMAGEMMRLPPFEGATQDIRTLVRTRIPVRLQQLPVPRQMLENLLNGLPVLEEGVVPSSITPGIRSRMESLLRPAEPGSEASQARKDLETWMQSPEVTAIRHNIAAEFPKLRELAALRLEVDGQRLPEREVERLLANTIAERIADRLDVPRRYTAVRQRLATAVRRDPGIQGIWRENTAPVHMAAQLRSRAVGGVEIPSDGQPLLPAVQEALAREADRMEARILEVRGVTRIRDTFADRMLSDLEGTVRTNRRLCDNLGDDINRGLRTRIIEWFASQVEAQTDLPPAARNRLIQDANRTMDDWAARIGDYGDVQAYIQNRLAEVLSRFETPGRQSRQEAIHSVVGQLTDRDIAGLASIRAVMSDLENQLSLARRHAPIQPYLTHMQQQIDLQIEQQFVRPLLHELSDQLSQFPAPLQEHMQADHEALLRTTLRQRLPALNRLAENMQGQLTNRNVSATSPSTVRHWIQQLARQAVSSEGLALTRDAHEQIIRDVRSRMGPQYHRVWALGDSRALGLLADMRDDLEIRREEGDNNAFENTLATLTEEEQRLLRDYTGALPEHMGQILENRENFDALHRALNAHYSSLAEPLHVLHVLDELENDDEMPVPGAPTPISAQDSARLREIANLPEAENLNQTLTDPARRQAIRESIMAELAATRAFSTNLPDGLLLRAPTADTQPYQPVLDPQELAQRHEQLEPYRNLINQNLRDQIGQQLVSTLRHELNRELDRLPAVVRTALPAPEDISLGEILRQQAPELRELDGPVRDRLVTDGAGMGPPDRLRDLIRRAAQDVVGTRGIALMDENKRRRILQLALAHDNLSGYRAWAEEESRALFLLENARVVTHGETMDTTLSTTDERLLQDYLGITREQLIALLRDPETWADSIGLLHEHLLSLDEPLDMLERLGGLPEVGGFAFGLMDGNDALTETELAAFQYYADSPESEDSNQALTNAARRQAIRTGILNRLTAVQPFSYQRPARHPHDGDTVHTTRGDQSESASSSE